MSWEEKKIFIGCDHAALEMKNKIIELIRSRNLEYEDMGTYSSVSCNYPDIAFKVSEKVIEEDARGILICGTGIGMSIAANKVKGIRAALCHNDFSANMARSHNNANVLCLGARSTELTTALVITKIWIDTEFDGNRHQVRLDIIDNYEEEVCK